MREDWIFLVEFPNGDSSETTRPYSSPTWARKRVIRLAEEFPGAWIKARRAIEDPSACVQTIQARHTRLID